MVLLARRFRSESPSGSTGDLPSGEAARPRASYRTDLITAVLGAWFVVGLFLDAWAHNNLTDLETFFTPWHGVFYSGFVATAAWICWSVLQGLLAGRRGLAAVPVGYGLAVLGVPMFAVAALGDLAWHTTFGIETSLNILFSPTHLALTTAMALIVTSPLRSAWANPATGLAPALRPLLPAVLSLSFATTLMLLFVQYANALAWAPRWIVVALSNPMDGTGREGGPLPGDLVSSVAVTNVVLLVPLLLVARRWRTPVGTATVLYATVAGLIGAITAFGAPAMLVMLLLAGVCVDALLVWLRPGPGRRDAFLAFAGLTSLITWALFLAVPSVVEGNVPDVVEYWTGLPVVAALQGLLLGVLAAPHATPVEQPAPV